MGKTKKGKQKNYTRIANTILEKLASFHIPGEEMQIVMAIIRKTYGYNKKSDKISFSQLEEMTGISRQNANRTIKKLEHKKIISVVRTDYSESNLYCLNEHFEKWGVSSKLTTGVVRSDDKSVVKADYYKRKKENNITNVILQSTDKQEKKAEKGKEPALPKSLSPSLQEFCSLFQKKTGTPYLVTWGKDQKIMKELEGIYEEEKLFRYMRWFFVSEDKFIRQAGYSVTVFKSVINKLVSTKGGIYAN